MKKTIITLAIAGFGLGVYGIDTIKSHVQTSTEGLRNVTRAITPDSYELKRVQKLIQGMDGKITRFEDKLHDIETKAAEHEEAADALSDAIRKDTAALKRERGLLESGNSTFVVHGQPVGIDRVAASATARLERLNSNQSLADTHRQHAADLDAAIADGRKQLGEALRIRADKEVELQQLAVRLENARLKEGIQNMVAPLDTSTLTIGDSELSESLKALEDRVRNAERNTRPRHSRQSLGTIIEAEVEPVAQDDLFGDIEAVLGSRGERSSLICPAPSDSRCAGY